jgi:hypothetical protein
MANVREILERTPPKILYHYTTQQGLLGIIRDREIWATHTQYLNDVREFRHALELAREELSAMREYPDRDERASGCLNEMEEGLAPGMESINVCVCSFSERGDVLSQWRAYGGSASGFAIGFSGDFLRRIIGENGWLVPVLYDEREQRDLIEGLLEDVLRENLNRAERDREPLRSGGNLAAYINRYAPILKHKSFGEEREWRIVTRPLAFSDERFAFRLGPSMLIPYFRLSLGAESLGIKEVVIGPTPHPEQSFRSLSGLLLKHDQDAMSLFNAERIVIRHSEVPYRNW